MGWFDNWIGSSNLAITSAESRAALEWRRIQDRPTQIEITRQGEQLPLQTVRVEWNDTARIVNGEKIDRGAQYVTVFGIRDHACEDDTDIQRSDRFTIEKVVYEVISIMTPPGEIQAVCEAGRGT